MDVDNNFLDATIKTKAEIDKWDCIKLKSFYIAKETINKIKRQFMEWQKMCANHISDKRVTSKIHEEFT